MSEYVDIKIKELPFWTFRNYLDKRVVSLFFTKEDLMVIPNCKEEIDDEDSTEYTKYVYKTTVQKARDRLDAMGFSIQQFELIFNSNIEIIDYAPFLRSLHLDPDDYEIKAAERSKKYITFQKWKNSMKKIIKYELATGNIRWNTEKDKININTECDKVIYYSLKDDNNDEYYYALDLRSIDVAYIFRLILENCELNDEIILDFTNIGYWSDESIIEALKATGYNEKTIVLVEGTSDKDILEFAMKQIYPHLSDLFYFMDFDDVSGGKRDGGTSFVVKNMKTFYFSKLKVKFIAIFDNDAEGYNSLCILNNDIKKWPANFRILLYPENSLTNSYPTILPNGQFLDDNINKKASSIELYLPDKLFKDENGYYPIEWECRKKIKCGSKEETLYQGVVSKKELIKNDFQILRRKIESGDEKFNIDEWTRMKTLLNTIVFAYKG